MRNGMKRAALGLAAAALCLGLMGCSLSSGFADYDVSGYFQALLDSSYKNQNENYATVAATTEENAQQNNTTTVRNAAVNFCNTYGVTPSDDQLSQLQEVMSQALAQASYTVQDEVKNETGYTLEIVIDPIVNFSDMGDDIRQLRNQAQYEATQANSAPPMRRTATALGTVTTRAATATAMTATMTTAAMITAMAATAARTVPPQRTRIPAWAWVRARSRWTPTSCLWTRWWSCAKSSFPACATAARR